MEKSIDEVIGSMLTVRFSLLEASKTSTGKPSYSSQACGNRMIAAQVEGWIKALKASQAKD